MESFELWGQAHQRPPNLIELKLEKKTNKKTRGKKSEKKENK